MASSASYEINFSDPDVQGFIVSEYTSNGPASPVGLDTANAATSLLIYGKGSPNYGERISENLVNILENFSGPTPPRHAINGQIWAAETKFFKNLNGIWYRYVDPSWIIISVPSVASLPSIVTVNDYVFNTTDGNLYQFSNFSGTNRWRVLSFIEQTTGVSEEPNVIGLLPKYKLKIFRNGSWSDIDSSENNSGIVAVQNTAPLYPRTGDMWFNSVGNQLYIYDGTVWEPLLPDVSNFVERTGDTMTGPLSVIHPPTSNLYATSKLYVDTEIANAVGTAILGLTTDDIEDASLWSPGSSLTFVLNQISGQFSSYLSLDGSNSPMVGDLFLFSHPPTGVNAAKNYQAATKLYVDSEIASALSGGASTLTNVVFNTSSNIMTFTFSDASTLEVENIQNHPHSHTAEETSFDASSTEIIQTQLGTTTDVQSALDELEYIAIERTTPGRIVASTNHLSVVSFSSIATMNIAGDHTHFFKNGGAFELSSSTDPGNDGSYTVDDTPYYDSGAGETIIALQPDLNSTTGTSTVIPLTYPCPTYPVGAHKSWVFRNGIKQISSGRPQLTALFTQPERGFQETGLALTRAEQVVRFSSPITTETLHGLANATTYTTNLLINNVNVPISINVGVDIPFGGKIGDITTYINANSPLTTASIIEGEFVLRTVNRGEVLNYNIVEYDNGVTPNRIKLAGNVVTDFPVGTLLRIKDGSNDGQFSVAVDGAVLDSGNTFVYLNEPIVESTILGTVAKRYSIFDITGTNTIRVEGDVTSIFLTGRQFRVAKSFGIVGIYVENDGYYTVSATPTFDGTYTSIVVAETLYNTGGGWISNGLIAEQHTTVINDVDLFSSITGYVSLGNTIGAHDDTDPSTPDPFEYTFTITTILGPVVITTLGRQGETWGKLLNVLNIQLLSNNLYAEIAGNRLTFYGPIVGTAAGTVAVDDGVTPVVPDDPQRLFRALTDYIHFLTPVLGFDGAYAEVGNIGETSDQVIFSPALPENETLELISYGKSGI